MQNKITSLFYIKRTKPNSLGLVPIYFRITVNGKRFEISTNKLVTNQLGYVKYNENGGYNNKAIITI